MLIIWAVCLQGWFKAWYSIRLSEHDMSKIILSYSLGCSNSLGCSCTFVFLALSKITGSSHRWIAIKFAAFSSLWVECCAYASVSPLHLSAWNMLAGHLRSVTPCGAVVCIYLLELSRLKIRSACNSMHIHVLPRLCTRAYFWDSQNFMLSRVDLNREISIKLLQPRDLLCRFWKSCLIKPLSLTLWLIFSQLLLF